MLLRLRRKHVLVEPGDLSEDVNTLEKIHQYYPYSVRIVNSDSIEALLITRHLILL